MNSANHYWLLMRASLPLLKSILCGICAVATASVVSAAIVDDIGPNTPNGAGYNYEPATSGLTIGLAGTLSVEYAVSLNAGVWRCANGGTWVQLPNSPPRAYSIAIDPNNSQHLAVGERDGDAVPTSLNTSGVWESYDGGDNWTKILDPFTAPGGCGSQAVPSVSFTRSSTLLAATVCGVAVRQVNGQFSFPSLPFGLDSHIITAVGASRTKAWARNADQLLVSTDDGASWSLIKSIPASLSVSWSVGDDHSLAAFDSMVFMSVNTNWPTGGNCGLLKYDAVGDNWSVERVAVPSGPLGDGTGLGGRKFLKAFDLNRPDLSDTLGQRYQLIYSAAEVLAQATGLNGDGTVSWGQLAAASASGVPSPDPIHSDFWDVDLRQDGGAAWLACDGGIFRKLLPSGAWATFNQDFHTHHIHSLTALPMGNNFTARFAYATPDNDAWFYDSLSSEWNTANHFGDANWTAGDSGNTNFALMARRSGWELGNGGNEVGLTGFGSALPDGRTIDFFTLYPDQSFDGPTFFQFITTLQGESPAYPLGDAVMLVNLPLHYFNGSSFVTVPGSLGQPSPSGGPVLIRNSQFAFEGAGGCPHTSPDADCSQFQNWQLLANDLPTGSIGFVVSGGHANPTFYAFTSNGRLYKRNANGSGWSLLSVNGLLPGGAYGPVFANPYLPNNLYVLTSSGIKVSTDGGNSFSTDSTLTSLLTASGKYPLEGNFSGGNGSYLVRSMGSRANNMGTLSHMAFDRAQPGRMVAASPFTGVFYNSGSGWTDLTSFLPKPLASVSAVGISGPCIYVATEGRGLLRIFLNDSEYCFIGAPVLSVPSPYSTVHAAYNAASGCNVIRINTGTYHETMPFTLSKHVQLQSQGGPVTISK